MPQPLIKVDVDFSGIEEKLSPGAIKRGQFAMANQALMEMEQYVPMRKGTLRAGAVADQRGVTYPGPYGRAHFYGTNGIVTFRKYTTAGTGKRWDKRLNEGQLKKIGKAGLKGMGIKT
ncbi:minor capsid protein [Eremococcus coleocola]|uniref:minor capsid protein n=1 Tax=Eremococcus coleocola TaxID=88132 RepID=UPI0004104396|nr:minor capsid protein [Eremococcus coleocola]